jgi:hypothetical protein
MATTVNITEAIQDGKWHVTTSISVGSDIPRDIYMYENTGTGLGSYMGVCTIAEYKKLQSFTGTAIPTFGNKYIRSDTGVNVVPLTTDPKTISDKMVSDITSFRTEFLAGYTSSRIAVIS